MNFKRFFLTLLALVISSICSPRLLVAQSLTTGSIAGVVSDQSGAVVPDAKIALRGSAQGDTRDRTTGKDGGYRFDLLNPGSYVVTVTATGFESSNRSVEVAVGQVSTANLQLKLGEASTTVTVEATAPLLNTENGNVSSTINESQSANIPNPGNDITYMAQLAPGSVMNTAGGGLGNFVSYGMSALTTSFTLNGMDYNDPFLNVNNSGATNLTLGQNEIQEVSIVTNGYSGEYGGLAGASVNYVTRSGTNEFHGRATYYWNGRALNANDWFHNTTTPVTPRSFVNANQYGADVGGPIKKDKLFFYFNSEGLYLLIPSGGPVNVPSTEFATATLANIDTAFPGGVTSEIYKYYQNIFNLYSMAPGANRALDTLPNHGCDSSVNLINPVAHTGFGTFDAVKNPLGTGVPCALQFQTTVGAATHENLQAGRVDWNVTNQDRFYTRIQHDRGLQASYTDPINPLFNLISDQPEWQGQAEETHSFNSGAVNQVIIASQWYQAQFAAADVPAALAAFPGTLSIASGAFALLGGIDYNFPQGRNVTQFQASDDYSFKPMGKHSLKVGIQYHRIWTTDHDFGAGAQGLTIPGNLDAFFAGGNDAVNGNSTLLIQNFPTALAQPFQQYSLGVYVTDNWKLTPNLMLTLAFRLDHQSNPVCSTNCFALPVVPFPFLSSDPATPYNELMKVGLHQMLPGFTAVEPAGRLGFAWQPHLLGDNNLVIRGGFGMFWDTFPAVLLDGIAENPPSDPQFVVAGANLSSKADPNSLWASAAASNAAFQAGFASGGSFESISAAVPGFTAPGLSSPQQNSRAAVYYRWSLGIQQQFGKQTALAVQYVGNQANHIFFGNYGINGFDGTGTFLSLPATVPNPNFATTIYGQTNGVANYNGVSVSLTHRYSSGQVQVNYLYGHSLDDVSNSGIFNAPFASTFYLATNSTILYPEDPANTKKFNYASSDQDIRNSLNANFVWELPIKRFITQGHGPDRLLKGWDVNGAVFVRSGFPLTPVDLGTGTALNGSNYLPGGSGPFATELTAVGGGSNCQALYGAVTPQPGRGICYNIADFSASPDGFPSTLRNSLRGPGYWDTDFSIMKHTQIHERAEFVIGAQFYNVFNHANFDAPLMNIASAQFGQILRTTSAPTTMYGSVLGADASPRLIQMKAQINF
jgi:Carboxypeptidase regulatory-like domain